MHVSWPFVHFDKRQNDMRSKPPNRNKELQQVIFLVVAITIILAFHTNSQQSKSTMPCQDIRYRIVSDDHEDRIPAVTRYTAYCGEAPLSIQGWTNTMANDPTASKDLTQIIRDSEYKAVFFEQKGCTFQNWDTKQFEFVLVDAPHLKSFAEFRPDPQAFAEHLACSGSSSGCAFNNLRGDARLIAPKALNDNHVAYSHLAAFCRQAPADQVAQVWQLAAQEYQQRVKNSLETVWFSTSGTGIAWLHFRLDSRPKYYQYKPFKVEK